MQSVGSLRFRGQFINHGCRYCGVGILALTCFSLLWLTGCRASARRRIPWGFLQFFAGRREFSLLSLRCEYRKGRKEIEDACSKNSAAVSNLMKIART